MGLSHAVCPKLDSNISAERRLMSQTHVLHRAKHAHFAARSKASSGFSDLTMGFRQPLRSAGRVQWTHTPHFSVGRAPLPCPCMQQRS